jgi:DNA-binding PadR family transcriptional regulator
MFRHFSPHLAAAGAAGCGHSPFDQAWQRMSGRHGPGRPGGPDRPGGWDRPGGGRGGPFGFGGPGGPPFGGGGRGGPFRGGRRARRGDVRTAALLLLAEEPRNGYQIMQELEERSGGAWRPSAGSIYPALQLLEDEGLVRSEEADGRKLLRLTDEGRKLVEQRGEEQPAPWDEMAGDLGDEAMALGKLMREVAYAFAQVMHAGSQHQHAEARKVLTNARRELYRILADGDPEPGDEGEAA